MGKMYDSAEGTIPALPNGGAGVDLLIPTDGQWQANGQKMRQQNPNAKVHTISEVGQVVAEWIDCEPGCVWPPVNAVNRWRQWRNQGCKGFYSSQSTQPQIRALLAPGENPEWFDADPGPDKVDPGDVATQYGFEGSYDITETTPAFEGQTPQPAPQPVPQPAHKEDPDMVLANDGQAQYIVTTDSAGHLVKNPIPGLNDPVHPELQQIAAAIPNLGTVPAFLADVPAGATA